MNGDQIFCLLMLLVIIVIELMGILVFMISGA